MRRSARPLVIGHRGASAARPENTVEAFRHAAELGADWVELDVRRTAEGALVIHHDAELPDGRVIVELAAAELPDSVATLAEALEACAGMGVNIEIKNSAPDPDFDPDQRIARAVVALLLDPPPAWQVDLDRILVSSFSRRTLAVVRQLTPTVPTGQLFSLSAPELIADWIAAAAAAGHVSVNPYEAFVDETLMAQARDAGLRVYPWTIDDPERMRQLIDLGVDGIITNVPDVARSIVDA